MKPRSLLLTAGAVVVLIAGLLMLPSFAVAAPQGRGKPIGSFLARFVIGDSGLLGIVNFNADGTWTASDQSDFGGVPGLQSRQSPWRGVWRMTGPRQLTATGICLNFGARGEPTGSNRISAIVDWERGFQSGKGVTSQRAYGVTENPLDPTAGKPAPPPLNLLPVTLARLNN